uniref:Uncharacterized protein n=1 Tax=Candidatus Kentrum sp. TUN TaxID=2126343 RepID=A0A450ZAC0_9GAMM|nr:MAG: hypothetical protein BECKTUN1418D_GA0071000_100142 [Candidatus Kentron sp. TUN]
MPGPRAKDYSRIRLRLYRASLALGTRTKREYTSVYTPGFPTFLFRYLEIRILSLTLVTMAGIALGGCSLNTIFTALPVLAYPVNSIRRCALLPQGAIFISPGLRRSRYPGYRMRGNPTPTGLRHSQTYCSSHSKPCFRRRVLYSSWKLRSL